MGTIQDPEMSQPQIQVNPEYVAWKNKVTYVLLGLIAIGIALVVCIGKLI